MPEGQTRQGAVVRLRDRAVATALRAEIRSWQLGVWVAVEVVVTILLMRVPLFDVLGYELALGSAVMAAPVGLGLGVTLARKAANIDAHPLLRARGPSRLILSLVWRAAAVAAVVTAIPALAGAIHGLWAPTCAWGFGIRAYLLMATTSAVLFAALGVAIGLLAGRRTWVAVVASIALVLGLAIACFWRFYSEPPVFLYSPLFGYFPGNLYDENIRLGAPLLWSRLEQLAWVLAVLAATAAVLDVPTLRPRLRDRRPDTPRRPALALTLVGLGCALLLHHQSGALGYAIDAEDIQAELGGVVESEHFVIYYAEVETVTRHLELLVEDHELRLAQLVETLEISEAELASLGKITSYVFASDAQKGRLMGARQVEMAKPWRREIYLSGAPYPLRHEIAHVVAGLFGAPWFDVSADRVLGLPLLFNPGLIEGLAVAVDWPGRHDQALTPHQSMRAMQLMGGEPSVHDVMSLGFLRFSSQRSYTAAGSFVKYLLDQEGGAAPLRRLYASGGDFEHAYGDSLRTLERRWRAMITAIPLSEDQVEMVRERFRVGGVFSRPCPHAIAARRDAAEAASDDGDIAEAIALRRAVCRDSPDEPVYRLELAHDLIRGSLEQRAQAIEILEAIAGDAEHLTTSVRASALGKLAGLAAAAGDWATAEARLAETVALPLPDEAARQAEARLAALRHTGPAGAALRGYFFEDDDPTTDAARWAVQATELEPALGLGWYLRGLQDALAEHPAEAITELDVALGRRLPSPRFVRYGARVLAGLGWKVGDPAAVQRAAALLEGPEMTEMDHLVAADWRWRLKWRALRVGH